MGPEKEYKITSIVLAVILIISCLMQLCSHSIRKKSEQELIEKHQLVVDSLNSEIDSLQMIIDVGNYE